MRSGYKQDNPIPGAEIANDKIQELINECNKEASKENETKQNLDIFAYYCQKLEDKIGVAKSSL